MINDKIREIQLAAMSRTFNGPDPDGDIDKMYIPNEFTRVFTELLVEECVRAVSSCDDDREGAYETGLRVAQRAIKDHFGVI